MPASAFGDPDMGSIWELHASSRNYRCGQTVTNWRSLGQDTIGTAPHRHLQSGSSKPKRPIQNGMDQRLCLPLFSEWFAER
jgi:hypothetical protein